MSAVKQNKALDFMKDYALYFVLLNPIFGPHHHCAGRGRPARYSRHRLVGGPPSRIGSSDFCHIAAGSRQCE